MYSQVTMHFNLHCICFLSIVIEINTLKVYLISTNDDTQLNLLSENIKQLLHLNSPRDDLRSDYESNRDFERNICNRHFGSIFGTKTQKLLCLENYYEDQMAKDEIYKRKRKQRKESRVRKPFLDLTRGLAIKTFSSDYLDVKDFARSMDADEFSNDYLDVGDLARDDDVDSRRSLAYETKPNKNPKDAKFKADSDSDSESSEEESDEKKRFQVVESKPDSDSESEDSDSSEEKYSRQKKKEPNYIYSQGRNRHVKGLDGRKRLQHFLPKRYHWEEDDIQKLGYYWFDGPRGKYGDARAIYEK